MPTKLKTLIAHAAAAGRKPFEPGRVRRQQQWLLYGSGVAITVFVLVCAALVAQLDLQESVARDRSEFLLRKADLLAEMEVVRALQNRYVENLELMARHLPTAPSDALKRFADDRGRLAVLGHTGRVAVAAFALMQRVASQPSRRGSDRSMRMRSGWWDTAIATPAAPSTAVTSS